MSATRTSGTAQPRRTRKADARARLTIDDPALALAGLAHEVRTPLNAILAFAELLAASDIPQRERDWALAIKSTAEHIAALSTLVVDGTRAELRGLVPARERFEPAALAHALAESLSARAAAHGLTAEAAIADDLPPAAIGDPVRLRAAAENLMDNAVKFTREGVVRLSFAAERRGDAIEIGVTVADQGPGLSRAAARSLFQPFAEGSRRGAGLGLAFARAVARALGGDVTVTSAPGQGATFRLRARVEAAEPAADAPRSNDAAAARSRKLRILCVEDNSFGRVVMRTLAAALGHAIDFCETGAAAVAVAAAARHDVILMDVTLPEMNGLEATRRIRRLPGAGGSAPIIGISGNGGAEQRSAALAAGMDAYLVKPISAAALARALDAAMSSDRAA